MSPEVSNWRSSPWLAAAEFTLFAGCFAADHYRLIPLTKIFPLVALAWIFLRLRGLRWRDLGFTRPDHWGKAIAIGTAVGIAMELLSTYGMDPLLTKLAGKPADLSFFRPLAGNLKFLLIILGLNWILAAFGEEMIYRGYLMNRFAGLMRGSRRAWIVSLILTTLVFGAAHGEGQGLTGIILEGWNGLLLGVLYLACGRQMAYPVIAHGVSNTMVFLLIYAGHYPRPV